MRFCRTFRKVVGKINEKSCAASNMFHAWEEIDFAKAKKHIIRLQKRIAVEYSRSRFDVVEALQHKMIHSFYAKAYAVKTVTSNRGKYTAGVDNVICKTSEDKYRMIEKLKRRGYKALPLKRIYIPKPNGDKRPLSIPTIKDRALQTVYKFALEPIAELTADECSFGFRLNRSAKDAIIRCYDILSENPHYEYVIKVDIKSCFDNISHKWILDNIPIDKEMLNKFIKCGYVYKGKYYQINKGVPQGGCLSTVICNMTLDGLEKLFSDEIGNSVRLVRYADDILIFGTSIGFLVQSVFPLLNRFLSERGLWISKEKTKICRINNGFSFLGYEIRLQNKNIIIVPTKKSVILLKNRISEILKGDFTDSYKNTYDKLNYLLRGWFNYYFGVVSEHTLLGVEYDITLFCQKIFGRDLTVGLINDIFTKIYKG